MTNAKILFDDICQNISSYYPLQEAKAIAFLVLEKKLGLSRTDVLIGRAIERLPNDWENLQSQLKAQVPVQYVLGEADFYGLRFMVGQDVLIPRNETEELVDLVIQYSKTEGGKHHILDIGTGSGCVAITLAKNLPTSSVWAYDISEKALAIAQQNATFNNVAVVFEQKDILKFQTQTQAFDIVVSNPPYVTLAEKALMQAHVLDHEPHLALFVNNDQALIFYEAIADFCTENLRINGRFFVEINEAFGQETAQVFIERGFENVRIIKDIHAKDRIVCGERRR